LKRGDKTNEERMGPLEAHPASVLAQRDRMAQNLELIEWKINYTAKGWNNDETAQAR
jgi:hypothetical protein